MAGRVHFLALLSDVDNPVRITLAKGRAFEAEWGGPTDEGWSVSWIRAWREGKWVYREDGSDGRDCDGRLSHFSLCRAHVRDLHKHRYDGRRWPIWARVEAHQRDYTAEAAGY